MAGAYDTEITMKGTGEELLSFLNVLKLYKTSHYINVEDDIDARFEGVSISYCEMNSRIDDLSEEQINRIKEQGGIISVEASGPYGHFEEVDDTRLFQNLADAAPGASFSGKVEGYKGSADVYWKAEFTEGKLNLKYHQDQGFEDDWSDWNDQCEDIKFVVTGKLNYFKNRDEIEEYIENRGGEVIGNVSKNTDFLICNNIDSASAKIKKAQELQIPVISEKEFITKFGNPEYFTNKDEAVRECNYDPATKEYEWIKIVMFE